MESTERYQDIIGLKHHKSSVYPHMTIMNRAAQFAPFAALKGYDDAIDETARFTEEINEHDEAHTAALNDKLLTLKFKERERPAVRVTYFRPDERKKGGAYCATEGTLMKVDAEGHRLYLSGGADIFFEQLIDIELL